MNYIDQKYINLVGPSLQFFKKKKTNLWNFRCPFCGDSDTSKTKARGYFFIRNNDVIMKCHNCGVSMSLGSFLHKQNIVLHKEWLMEKFREKYGYEKQEKTRTNDIRGMPLKQPIPDVLKHLVALNKCQTNNLAKKYVIDRKIPFKFHRLLYWCDNFANWVQKLGIENAKDIRNPNPKLIIPFFTADGKDVFAFQARSLLKDDRGAKYITLKITDHAKIYGLERVKLHIKHHILEGPIDSMFLPNAIAMAGSDLSTFQNNLDSVFIFDNEPRSYEIHHKMEDVIHSGNRIVIWPNSLHEKDVNEMVLQHGHEQTLKIIEESECYGIQAQLRFVEWKRR